MEPTIMYLIIGAVALIVGIILGKIIFAKNTQKRIEEAEQEAKRIIADGESKAESLKKEKLLEAKEKFVQLKADHDRDVMQRQQKIGEGENRIKQKEQSLNQKEANLEKQLKENESIKENLNRQIEIVNIKRTE
ncbi:MAG TPA: Rnase Y domain-containing protein, partial [Ferruginibacter sp.]|nr:Rnase Y domain-containing protein [Ferruginibacter sp.]